MRAQDFIDESKTWESYEYIDDNLVSVLMYDGTDNVYSLDYFIEEIKTMQMFTNPSYGIYSMKQFFLTALTLGGISAADIYYFLTANGELLTTALLIFGTALSYGRLRALAEEGLTINDIKKSSNVDIRINYGDEMIKEAEERMNKTRKL